MMICFVIFQHVEKTDVTQKVIVMKIETLKNEQKLNQHTLQTRHQKHDRYWTKDVFGKGDQW